MSFSYSATGSQELSTWEEAARTGGCMPERPQTGERRCYRVDAWVDAGGTGFVNVSRAWFSGLSDVVRRALLKELRLPVRKPLVFRGGSEGQFAPVADFRVEEAFDGWCVLLVRLADREASERRVDSTFFADMNSGDTE